MENIKIKPYYITLRGDNIGVLGSVQNPKSISDMLENERHGMPEIEVIRSDGTTQKYVRATHGVPEIAEVMHKNNATIVKWADGTKTYAVCGEGETYDPYTGFMAAVMKKLFGSTGAAKAMLKKKNLEEQAARERAASERKAKEEAERKAAYEAENAEKIALRRAKAEKRRIDKIAEEMRIEMLARKQAEKMIYDGGTAQCSGSF